MTIDELIERLKECRDELGGDAEVRLMTQQQWPFENAIAGVTSAREICQQEDEEDFDPEGDSEVLYLARRGGHAIREIPVHWANDPNTRVNLLRDSVGSALGLVRIRWRALCGTYATRRTDS